jgi:hypothetical protein
VSDPIGRIARSIIEKAIERGAQEVRVEPLAEKMAICYQVDDKLCDEEFLPKHMCPLLVGAYSRLERPADKLAQGSLETRNPPRNRHYAIWDDEKQRDLCVACSPTPHGDKVVIKIVTAAGWKSGWRRRRLRLLDLSSRSKWDWNRRSCNSGADLTGADLTGADLTGAHYDNSTRWPAGFDPQHHGAVRVE